MKLVVLVAVALLVGVSALTPQEKSDLAANNQHHVETLDPLPKKDMLAFLNDLSLHETFIKLSNGIKGGHSIMYQFKEGKDVNIVKELAEQHGLSIINSRACECDNCCGRIVLPGGEVVEANVVPDNRQERAGMPKTGFVGGETLQPEAAPEAAATAEATEAKVEGVEAEENKEEAVEKGEAETTATDTEHAPYYQELKDKNVTAKAPLTEDQKKWYFDNNVAQISKMNVKAQAFVQKFINDLREHAPSTVIHFMSPIPNGHAIRFTVVEGDEAPISTYANTCGMHLEGDTLTAPGGEVADAEDTAETDDAGHEVAEEPEETADGAVKPLTSTGKIQRVKALPDKWMKATPEFLEDDADADALIMTPAATTTTATTPKAVSKKSDDDSDALIAVPTTTTTSATKVAPKATTHKSDDDSDALIAVPTTSTTSATKVAPKATTHKSDDDSDALISVPTTTSTTAASPKAATKKSDDDADALIKLA